ncbi:MAG: alpha/beta hydrolase [Flavobacteriaceae bacterium]|nr:alpha/beta hydrolase [Flavobacteriaceae bacterium]|tara:strand:- start:375453 stop:376238 length:786 start_codon:yes stop_codon:yes gene_type:complete
MLRTVEYRNVNISYSLQGKGNCIVLLHGFLENRSIWKEISELLSKRFKVIALDLPGHGQTDCLSYVHSMDEMAEVVRFILKKERIRRCILIGHSMGGYVSLAFAEEHPKMVKGLCLLNSTSVADSDQRKEFRDLAIRTAKKSYEKVVRISVRNLFSEDNQIKLKPKVEEIIQEAVQTPLQGYVAAQEGMKLRPNREHVLKNADFNKLQITGKYDEVIWLEDAQQESTRTNTDLVVLEGGHMSFIENHSELSNILLSFVKKC